MSVLSYLSQRASEAVLSGLENHSIKRSTELLEMRLRDQLGGQLQKQFRFGSSTRGTILPRSMDERSDIDYMVVFKDKSCTPQTYLDRIRRFVQQNYGQHSIYQSNPTIVLELNHIKFDLVPAIESWWDLYIPKSNGNWQSTDPRNFSKRLATRNSECDEQLKPAIRLVKYWNARNGYPFESFVLEQEIANQLYPFCGNLKEYFFKIFDHLSSRCEEIPKCKPALNATFNLITQIKQAEKSDPLWAEFEIKKLIPEKRQNLRRKTKNATKNL